MILNEINSIILICIIVDRYFWDCENIIFYVDIYYNIITNLIGTLKTVQLQDDSVGPQ